MSLSHDIISEFVKVTNNNKEKPKEGIVYATIVQGSDGKYVKIDGSDLLTPADTTTDIEDGERVTVMIKDHKATVTGNVTSPSASGNRVDKVVDTVTEQIGVFETVVADKVSTNELEAYKATIEYLVAGKAEIEDLEAINAKIENLEVKDAEIENAVIDKATIEDLEAVNAVIENLKVKDAEIENAVVENLEATKADIQILNADFAQIKTLVSGNLTSDNILSFNITADKVTMEDAFIKDAMIANVNAAKINAGRINTNSVVIGSEDGGMSISGATQQFTDKNGNVRIQIGRDASNDFTFALYGEDGQGQLINQNGITASAISDGIIVNDMISDDASISGGKLDISSVVTEINNDNTTTIKSNKIYLDEQNQSLEVAFKSLKTQVDTIKDIDSDLTTITDKIQSNTSKIEANKSSISTLIAEDAAIKKQVTDLEGNVVETTNTLTSKYTSLQQNLDGFKTTVNNTYATKTSVNDVKNNLSSNYSTTSTMNSAINQKVDEITASVSSTYATKNEVKTIDDNIKANYSTTEQMESAISVAKNEINLGISQIYETKTEVSNKVGDAITTSKNYTDSQIKISKDAIELGVSQTYETKSSVTSQVSTALTSAKSYADTKKSEAISTASSDATSKANNALTSAKSYADTKKSEAITSANNTLNTTIANYYTKAQTYTKTEVDSAIKLSKDTIELGVSQKYETKTSVSSQVSTVLTSAKSYADTKKSEAIAGARQIPDTRDTNENPQWYMTNYPRQTITEFKYSSTVGLSNVGSTYGAVTTVVPWNDNSGGYPVQTYRSNANNATYERRGTSNTTWGAWRQIEDSASSQAKATQAKTEAITSANNTLTTTIANYYTKTQTDSQIKIAKDAINLGVSETYETKTNVTSKVNSAISTASSDATSKANNALNSAKSYADTKKTEAINSANNTLNTTIANYYTKSQTDSQINIAKDNITSSISSLRTDIMNTSFTNLLLNSDFQYYQNGVNMPSHYESLDLVYCYGGGWLCPEGGKTIHINTVGSGRDWLGWKSHVIKASKDQVMTASVYVATDNINSFNSYLGLEIEWLNSNYERIICSGLSFNIQNSHTWERKSITGTAPEGTAYVRIYCWHHSEGISWWGKPMLQMGSVCTAWDKGGSIDVVEQRLSSAEQKITDTAITNTVKQNFYTKQETENAITSKGYATQSQVQQTAENIQFKFTQTGGYNLIRNGNPKPSREEHWWVSGNGWWHRDNPGDLGIRTNDTNEAYAGCATFKVQPGKTYSLSCWLMAETNTKGADVYFIGSANDDGAYTEVHHLYGGSGDGQWVNVKATFTLGSNINYGFIRIDNNGRKDTSIDWNTVVFFGEVQMVKGSEYYPQWSPNPNEIYDGITTIDKDGVTVKGSNGAYTNFNSTGMNSFNNSGQQTLGIRNGGITFHPYSSNQLGAYITQSALHGNSAAANGLAISTANNGTYISLGTSSLSDANTTLNMDQALTVSANDNFQPKGINLWKDTHAHGYGIRQLSHLRLAGSGAIQFDYLNTSPSTIYEAVDGGHSLYVMGGYQTHIGCMDGTGTPKGLIWMQNSTNTHSYTHWNFHNYTMYNMKTATSYANTLTNRYIETYGINSNVDGIRYLYRNIELIDGVGIRNLPNGYKGCPYDIVSIVCKGRGHAWVECEDEYRFIINGDCKSVNVEIIIYPTDGVMTMSSLTPDESPTLEAIPERNIGEQPEIITNEDFISVESEQE